MVMKRNGIKAGIVVLTVCVIMAVFGAAVSGLEKDRQKQGKQQLEEVLRRTAATCYAAEGCYPPDLDYMCNRYGLRYDEAQYKVYYELFASNLMPNITVLDK